MTSRGKGGELKSNGYCWKVDASSVKKLQHLSLLDWIILQEEWAMEMVNGLKGAPRAPCTPEEILNGSEI